MKLTVLRYSDDGQTSLGLLMVDGVFYCYTLEDTHRDKKIKHHTRIPQGGYTIKYQDSVTDLTKKYRSKYNWFDKHLHIKNVPGFKGIYIHNGNNYSNTSGCLLVGSKVISNKKGLDVIENSVRTFKNLYKLISDSLSVGELVSISFIDMDKMIQKANKPFV